MPIEPLRVDLAGGRYVELTPAAKGFPDLVRLIYDDGLKNKRVIADFKITAATASRVLEREINLGMGDFNQLSSHYLEWSEAMLEVLRSEGPAELVPQQTPPYNLKQRMITQPRNEALIYEAVNSAGGVLAVLKKKIEQNDVVLEWDKDVMPFLVCLDLDFHDPEAQEKPDEDELDRLGYALSPAPVCWWRSQGNGLKAIYTATPEDLFTAEELAVGAAAQLMTTVSVLRGKGTVELASRTRHPGSQQKGKRCGPLIPSIPNDTFNVLARFSRSEATEAEVNEVVEAEGFTIGDRLDHSYCLIDPQHVSTGTPIHVGHEGLYCHSCAARLGHGLMSWGWIRKRAGYSNESERSLAPIRKAFEQMVHVDHVDYLFATLFPALPESFRRTLYKAQLKKTHGADPRLELAFKSFFFVRGLDCWLHSDTLLPVGKALAAADVGVLPSCVRYNAEEGTFSPVQANISVHTNNGRVPGWVPILAYQFEPIFFVHNEAAEDPDRVRCFPKRRTTRDRVSYVALKDRMPLAKAEQLVADYFPGINLRYVKALIIAAGCAESGIGGVPMLWATGPTEAAKTTTIRVVNEMYGESFQNLSGVREDRLDQLFGEAMQKTRLLVFDDFAKVPADYQRLHTFIIRLNRGGHTYHALYVGGTTPPMDNAVILTDWRIPAFFSQDPQFGRRVHLLRLDNRIPIGWDKLGRMAEDWWKKTPEMTQAANSLHSWVVDEYFPPDDKESFAVKMERLGVPKLEDEAMASDAQGAVQELVVQLIRDIAESQELDATTQKRIGRGARYIDWKGSNLGRTCSLLIDSMGKGVSTREPERTYNIENLKHVLDPYQLHMTKMFDLSEGIASVEFDVKAWGEQSYVRLVESGRSTRSRARKVNGDLFKQWPPVLRGEPEPEIPMDEPAPPKVQEVVATLQHVAEGVTVGMMEKCLDKLENADDGEVVVVEGCDPIVAYLDFESQSACNIKKHGSYVYAQHASTKVMCAAIRVDGRKIFWTLDKYNLQMPEGVEYEHGRQFLLDMVTDPAGLIIVAHNVGFERPMWVYNLGLPEPLGWRDTMDKTLSLGLPAGADEAGQTILGMGKDLEGQAFIRKIWGPNKKGDLPPLTDAVIQRIIGYNFRDTDISYGIAQKYGLDMEPAWEQQVCSLHHDINHFGIHVDKEFAKALRDFDTEFKDAAGDHVEEITRDPVTGVPAITRADLTRNDFLREQLNLNLPPEWQLDNMRQTSLEAILEEYEEDPEAFAPEVIEVIKCRLVVTRASMAKVEKALDTISKDGRAKAQLRYHGAATGRWSGYQIQPQNMKRPGEDFDLPAAIKAIETRDKAAFLALCKDEKGKSLPPYELLGSLVRGVLTPAPGNTFVVGDFASIEARAVLWLAGDEEGLLEYRRKDAADEAHPKGKDPTVPDSYQNLAGFLFNKDPVTVSKKERGGGKIGILACLAKGTPVLTDSGWKPIETVKVTDKVWDGVEWVAHEGVIFRGVKRCHETEGVWATNDHLVQTREGWMRVDVLRQSTGLLRSASEVGSWSYAAMCAAPCRESVSMRVGATAVPNLKWNRPTGALVNQHVVMPAPSAPLLKLAWPKMGSRLSCQTMLTGAGGSIVTVQRSAVVLTPEIGHSRTMAREGSGCATHGWTNGCSCVTSSNFLVGTTLTWRWIERTTTGITNQETSDSSHEAGKCEIPASRGSSFMAGWRWQSLTSARNAAPATATITPSSGRSGKARLLSRSSLTRSAAGVRTVPTYDLKNVGPRNCFQAGTLLVHNCGFGGGPNAVDRMALPLGVDLASVGKTSQDVVDAYRGKYPKVRAFWYECERAFKTVLLSRRTTVQTVGRVTFKKLADRVQIILPSGRPINYMNARIDSDPYSRDYNSIIYDNAVRGKTIKRKTYGGKIVENIVQAFCRDLLANVMLQAADAGAPIPFHVHDEVILEVLTEYAEKWREWLQGIMRTAPDWAKGMPVFSKPELMVRYGK